MPFTLVSYISLENTEPLVYPPVEKGPRVATPLKHNRQLFALIVLCLLLVPLAIGAAGMHLNWYRSPYSQYGKRLAWMLGIPEPAYNFDVVLPGRLYRSGMPDDRFLVYVQKAYGVRHVVGLTGAVPVYETARKLGMQVTIFDWTRAAPTSQAMRAVLEVLNANEGVLVHCNAGRDRTGFVIATHRVLRQHWSVDRAIQEMERHGRKLSRHAETVSFLGSLLQPSR